MSTFTENFNLLKISLGDSPPDITVLNSNFDIIDELLSEIMKERVSLTGMGNTIFQSESAITKTGISSGEMLCIAKFIAPVSGVFKVNLSGHYSNGFASVHLIDTEHLLLEATGEGSYSLNSAGFFYNHSTVGEIKRSSHIISRSGFIADLENTEDSYETDIYCKAGQPYVIVAQVYEGENTTVTISNVTITYGNEK